MDRLLPLLGPEITDPEEETFLLFSQSIPSNSLGFVHNKAELLDVSIAGKDFSIHQSPGLLRSDRKEGTTGAVLWQVTPRFAEWIASSTNCLFANGILDQLSNVLELGCGVSGLLSLVLAPKVNLYIATDQPYTLKLLKNNIMENMSQLSKGSKSSNRIRPIRDVEGSFGNIRIRPLDWETDSVASLYSDVGLSTTKDQIHLVVACDCIYNESLVEPFVNTCAEICQLCPGESTTLCIVAQQLRSPDVFEAWLRVFHAIFRTWRLPDDMASPDIGENSGFVVHIGLLRNTSATKTEQILT